MAKSICAFRPPICLCKNVLCIKGLYQVMSSYFKGLLKANFIRTFSKPLYYPRSYLDVIFNVIKLMNLNLDFYFT